MDIQVRYDGGEVPYVFTVDAYPDGTPFFHHDTIPDHRPPAAMLLRPRSLVIFQAALYLADAWNARSIPLPHLILPLVPGSRQDRLSKEGDYLFTLKSVAADINARHFPSVTVLDPHSDVTPALIDRCRVITAAECLEMCGWTGKWGRWSAVVAPDGGAVKRAGQVAEKLGLPVIHGWKTRDVETGKLTGFGAQELSDIPSLKPLLLVDDLCDGGGTFVGLAEVLKRDNLPKPDLYVTHGLFSKGLTVLSGHFGRILTTNSILRPATGSPLEVLNVCTRLLTR